MQKFEEALNAAVAAAGGVSSLAEKLKVPYPSTIHNWRSRGCIPAQWGPAIERETGVPCERLCPHTVWVRVKDSRWRQHPKGRPLADYYTSNQAGRG